MSDVEQQDDSLKLGYVAATVHCQKKYVPQMADLQFLSTRPRTWVGATEIYGLFVLREYGLQDESQSQKVSCLFIPCMVEVMWRARGFMPRSLIFPKRSHQR